MSIVTIREDGSSYGMIRYFESDRCLNDQAKRQFNKDKIIAEEFVTFDCGLMEMKEIEKADLQEPAQGSQLLAVIFRPEIEPNEYLEREKYFEFCGYDLVDLPTCTSAITNCGAGFEKAIRYERLNHYGLLSTYKEAVLTQLDLNEKYPEESHAYCELAEVWRHIAVRRIYRPLPELDTAEINRIMVSGTIDELIVLPLTVGEYSEDWKAAQDICIQLAEHKDERVRANAALGLAYIARTKRKLDKHLVKPVLLKLLRECTNQKWRIVDSIEDINLYLNWHMAEKHLSKLK